MAAQEQGLRTTIVPSLMPTTTTGLRGMSGVYFDYLNTACLPFVGDEVIELGESPRVQFALILDVPVLFATPHLGGVPDVGEVFQYQGTASRGMLDNPFGKDMVCIPVKPCLPFAQLFQVTFG